MYKGCLDRALLSNSKISERKGKCLSAKLKGEKEGMKLTHSGIMHNPSMMPVSMVNGTGVHFLTGVVEPRWPACPETQTSTGISQH